MRVIEINEPGDADVLRLAERPQPVCGMNDVLIEVTAAGVNRPDIMQRRGLYLPPADASDLPGLEVAGVVSELGDGVTEWRVGDEVCALTNGGGYAEFVTVPAGQCLAVPAGLNMVEAAGLPETFFTVWSNVFDRGRLQKNETLLVHGGTSGIGVTAIQMAVALGSRVFATAGTARKCQACIDLGAEQAVNYREDDFVSELMHATDGQGVDVILDMVGGDYINRDFQLAATDGRIVSIAFQAGPKSKVNFAPVMMKRLTYTGSTLRPQSSESKAAIAKALRKNIWPHIEAGRIKPVIAETFPLVQASAAHELMEQGSHIGKIILRVKV